MHDFTPTAALIGGGLIGAAASLVLLTHGKVAGVSGLYGGLLRRDTTDLAFRIWFLSGMVLTGFVGSAIFPSAFASSWNANMPALVVAGLLVGVGTQIGTGCTSGHGVCGVSRLSLRSLVATLTFVLAGMFTVFVVRHVLGGSQ